MLLVFALCTCQQVSMTTTLPSLDYGGMHAGVIPVMNSDLLLSFQLLCSQSLTELQGCAARSSEWACSQQLPDQRLAAHCH